MNYRYLFIIASLITGAAHADIGESVCKRCEIVASDFDDVLTKSALSAQIKQMARILGFKDFARCVVTIITSSEARAAVYGAIKKNLKDSEGKPVIGTAAYVDCIFKHMPFISEERKKQIVDVAWYVKPNIELIEFYQQLQNYGIPIYVWTNNDKTGYDNKIIGLNRELERAGKPAFKPAGIYCANSDNQKKAKHDPNYFYDAYKQIQSPDDVAAKKILFIDDKAENVKVAREAARQYGLNLEAFVYRGKPADLNALRAKFKV